MVALEDRMGKRKAEVAAQIEKAFSEAPYPGDDRLLHPQCCDDMDIAVTILAAARLSLATRAVV